jgi:hypothetical protein
MEQLKTDLHRMFTDFEGESENSDCKKMLGGLIDGLIAIKSAHRAELTRNDAEVINLACNVLNAVRSFRWVPW